jgi:CRISPR system Cascade subunit CasE
MYLSRLILNPRSRQVRSELARPYEMHRTLLHAFPTGKVHTGRTEKDAAGLLFRLDEDARTGNLQLLAQSQLLPDWTFLTAADYLLLSAPGNPGIREVALQLAGGQVLAFRLRANPTRRLNTPAESKGKRVGIYAAEAQLAWLARKGNQHGFRLLQAAVSREGKVNQAQAVTDQNGTHDLKLFGVQFDGMLQVTDPTLLREAVAGGIGSGKAFGFGLLSLARPQ